MTDPVNLDVAAAAVAGRLHYPPTRLLGVSYDRQKSVLVQQQEAMRWPVTIWVRQHLLDQPC